MVIRNLSFSYDREKILKNISLEFAEGKISTLMGANGSGKSTLLNLCSGTMDFRRGRIKLNGRNIKSHSKRELAKEIAIVFQQNIISGDIRVEDYVSYGRIPYLKAFQKYSDEDKEHIDFAIRMMDLDKIRSVELRKLSGGQRQRALLAMAIAKQSKILLLDEPTSFLDIKYQVEILELVKKINRELGISVIMVLHDLSQIVNYSDEVIGLKEGELVFKGAPSEVLTGSVLSELYDTKLKIVSVEGKSIVLPA